MLKKNSISKDEFEEIKKEKYKLQYELNEEEKKNFDLIEEIIKLKKIIKDSSNYNF